MKKSDLTHLDEHGRASMVDVSDKPSTRRTAVASGRLLMRPDTLRRVVDGDIPKGNVVEVARLAGIQACKRTAELIPLCHPLPLSHADVRIESEPDGLRVIATATTTGPTGVEMEALTAASVALLTLYDMCKGVERGMEMTSIRLEEKRGGRSGHWRRDELLSGTREP
jgi:cyclic pyranopterin phosphate synthase